MLNYSDLLLDPRWKSRRKEIIERDGYTCNQCHNKELVANLEVGLFFHTKFRSGDPIIAMVLSVNSEEFDSLVRILDSGSFPEKRCLVYYDLNERLAMAIRMLTPEEEKKLSLPKLLYKRPEDILYAQNSQEIINDHTTRTINQWRKFGANFKDDDFQNYSWLHVLGLHVHHTYYQKGKLPWEYPDSSLQCLCASCHEELHQNQIIPVYDEKMKSVGHYHYCHRCHGAGWFPEYMHVQAGICFRCRGARYEELIGTSI